MRASICIASARNDRRAFTLVELMVVLGIIALLIALLLPTLRRVRESAQATACASNLRQIAMLMALYAQSNDGRLPYQAIELSDWSGALSELSKSTGVFRCPADMNPRRDGFDDPWRSYAVNCGVGGVADSGYRTPWPENRHALPERLAKIPWHVVLLGENHGAYPLSGAVVGIAEAEGLFGEAVAVHKSIGGNFAFSDGRVELRTRQEMEQYPADELTGGGHFDPWKWKR